MISKAGKIIIAALILFFMILGAGLYRLQDLNYKKAADILAQQAVAPVGAAPKFPAPDLDRPINITAKLSEESAGKAREYIIASENALKADPDIYEDWLNLALYRKLIGDYEAAREIWEYLTKIRPFAAVSYHNLGNLYAYELNEPDKAEPYYLKAIELEPSGIQWYLSAADYYRYFKKDITKAKDILRQGIAANPGIAEPLAQTLNSF